MTTADFLTSVTDTRERRIRQGYERRVPRTPEELESAYKTSAFYRLAKEEIHAYKKELQATGCTATKNFRDAVLESKSRLVPKRSPYTVSFARQVAACTRREFWLLFHDHTTSLTKAWVTLLNALVVGSLFYGQVSDTSGAFGRGGAVFFSILFLGWVQLSELNKAVAGRIVIQRHKNYAFYRPSAVAIARSVADLPVLLVETALFSVIMYFLATFEVNAGKFWIYFLLVFVNTYCTTALYRLFAALSPSLDDAVRFSGIAFNLMVRDVMSSSFA